MNVMLNLTISRNWFDMIASGEKREEYRSGDNTQVCRVYKYLGANGWPMTGDVVMILRNGYRMDSPALAVVVKGFDIRSNGEAVHPEWGEPNCKHGMAYFIIMLGRVLVQGTYAEVREATA